MEQNIQIETFEWGITRRYIDTGAIVIIETEGHMDPHAIDAWFDVVQETLRSWPKDQTVLIMNDLSHPRQGVSRYSRQRGEELYADFPHDVPVYAALVFRNTIGYQLASLYINMRRRRSDANIKAFTNREVALQWLRDHA